MRESEKDQHLETLKGVLHSESVAQKREPSAVQVLAIAEVGNKALGGISQANLGGTMFGGGDNQNGCFIMDPRFL